MIYSGTGHRPDKLATIDNWGQKTFNRLVDLARAAIDIHLPAEIMSGMALGWDMALAQAAILGGIPLLAAVPFKGQESKWNHKQQDFYNSLLSKAKEIIIVSEGTYTPDKLQTRNEHMVDNSDVILALFNGSRGGTGNCIRYAKMKNKPIHNYWNSWIKYKGL